MKLDVYFRMVSKTAYYVVYLLNILRFESFYFYNTTMNTHEKCCIWFKTQLLEIQTNLNLCCRVVKGSG